MNISMYSTVDWFAIVAGIVMLAAVILAGLLWWFIGGWIAGMTGRIVALALYIAAILFVTGAFNIRMRRD